MMTGLTIVLAASMLLFVASLAYAIIQDLAMSNRIIKRLVAEHTKFNHHEMPNSFQRAARRPARVLSSFIL